MPAEELDGVIAHELAHIRNRDTLLMTVTATLAGALSNIATLGMFFGGSNDDENPNPIAAIAMALVAPIVGALLQFAVSRQREFLADRVGAEISGRPLSLARALRRLEADAMHDPVAVSPAAASLAIINPLGPAATRAVRWFATHPPTTERVARLAELAATMRRAA
jgi:heat shock protein HtpX